jgi:hypothetical protein
LRPTAPARTRRTFAVGLLAALVTLAAADARAQAPGGQAGKPQPAPAPKVAAPKGTEPASAPQAATPKKAGPPGTIQKAPAAKPPAPKKRVPPRTSRVWKGRGFAVFSGGAQVAAPGHHASVTFKVHAEDAMLDSASRIRVGPVFSVRGGVRVWKNLALGADVGVASTSQRLAISGSLPHPFQFNAFRRVEGTASGLDRLETVSAVEASWYVALKRRVDMLVFAGPAYFDVRQDMATSIRFTEVYPYDSATFTGVESTRVKGSAVGFTAGADVAYLLTKSLGVGGELRYSYASATLKPSGRRATVPLGGLQVSVSARFLF